MTEPNQTSAVGTEHLLQFGIIIHLFAKIEALMQVAAAGILDTDLGTAMVLMGDMNYRQKRQTLKHLNTTIGIDGFVSEELTALLDDLHKQSKLRNWIAHATWNEGRRTGSIKPMQLYLRREEPVPLGHHHNEPDYAVEDLKISAKKLDDIDRRFNSLLKSSGLMARVEARIEAIKSPIGPSPG